MTEQIHEQATQGMRERAGLRDAAREAGEGDMQRRTADLSKLEADHEKRVAGVRADEDLTREAKDRKTRELLGEHAGVVAEAQAAVLADLDADILKAEKRAYAPDGPSSDTQAELAKELRLQRLEREIFDDLANGRDDALIAYERAVRFEDHERAAIIGRVGADFLVDPTRKLRLSQLVEENLPPRRKEAKRDLARLQGTRRQLVAGFGFRSDALGRRQSNFGGVPGFGGPQDAA